LAKNDFARKPHADYGWSALKFSLHLRLSLYVLTIHAEYYDFVR